MDRHHRKDKYQQSRECNGFHGAPRKLSVTSVSDDTVPGAVTFIRSPVVQSVQLVDPLRSAIFQASLVPEPVEMVAVFEPLVAEVPPRYMIAAPVPLAVAL